MSSVGILTWWSLSKYSLNAASKIKNKKYHELEFEACGKSLWQIDYLVLVVIHALKNPLERYMEN